MHVELIDTLRCAAPHEDSWLVAAATRTDDRDIIEGTLGCPVCGAEYAIRDGQVWFGGEERAPMAGAARFSDDEPIRLAAMLGLDERGGLYVLHGAWARYAAQLAAQFPHARLVAIAMLQAGGAGVVLRCTGDAIPLAAGGVRGVALDRASPALGDAAVRVLGVKGRLVSPAATGVPGAITVLARDDDWWVGERQPSPTVSAPVTPRRAAPRTGNR